ncbi:MAG: nicotinate phosphoribosyltransferase, partial [Planctomycetaceae bacterium]|nr:nicotinate phosphoribosyltransferase [Planctomycetaceae bacterium]
LYGIPVKGTHAHSWVMCFGDEREAFHEYAKALPNNCVFLVDTYDTLQGVRNAIETGRWLRETGHEMVGIRLDSGDLAELSIAARKLLDEAGFPNARIVASNDLDEYQIEMLHKTGAKINVWGVGTRLATGGDQPALGGVYKLAAIRERDPETDQLGPWQHRIKLSEQPIKTTNPGLQQVRRFSDENGFLADAIYEVDQPPQSDWTILPFKNETPLTLPSRLRAEDLLVPIFRNGQRVYDPPSATEARDRRQAQIDQLPDRYARLNEPETFPVGLEQSLHQLKLQLIQEAKSTIPQA